MASEQSAVSSNLSGPATILSTAPVINQNESDIIRTKSLKRSRADQSQNSAGLNSITNTNIVGSPSPKSPRFTGAFTPGITAIALTGAAALADQRREESQRMQPGMSENPGHKALSSLMAGGGTGMSKPQDAPVATTSMSEGMSTAANAISISSPLNSDDKPETSPASVTSLASLGSTAPTATANSTTVASPVPINNTVDNEARDPRQGLLNHQQVPTGEQLGKRPLTFPGNVLGQADPSRTPSRGMSLPMPGQNQQLAPRSPSQKKHKCPYCETEFTRHHNLKSHLLTHSQEKPYVCQTCNMRFRRLHDLKRHMKLHTGERPHICPKCDRKFARGDALARHSKGQGGCAGRRSSMGSFGGDDDFEGSNVGDGDEGAMDGVLYTNGTPHPNENEMSEEDRRRLSLPSIKAQHVSGPSNFTAQSRTPSTYPPAGPRPGQSTGGLYPPTGERGGSTSPVRGHTPGSSLSSMPLSTGGTSMFSASAMTESPKPLSPAGMHTHQLGHDPSSMGRQRSPSLTTQFQQQHFGRRQGTSPPGMSLPSPLGNTHPQKLPALSGLAPPEQRYTLTSQTPGQQNSNNGPQQVQSGATSPSTNNLFTAGERGVWEYVQSLEERQKQLIEKVQAMENKEKSQEDKINRLSEEVFMLRSQLNAQTQGQQQAPGQA